MWKKKKDGKACYHTTSPSYMAAVGELGQFSWAELHLERKKVRRTKKRKRNERKNEREKKSEKRANRTFHISEILATRSPMKTLRTTVKSILLPPIVFGYSKA